MSARLLPAQYPQQPPYPQESAAYPSPVLLALQQLDTLVGRIALYPDGLLAQVLTAATFSNEIPDAANLSNAYAYMNNQQIAAAIQEDRLPFDPSVIALLPFSSILNQMAQDPGWTQQLGTAVLAQHNDVMDAVQRMRRLATTIVIFNQYERVIVGGPGVIEIDPVAPGTYYVPVYNPAILYSRPRPRVWPQHSYPLRSWRRHRGCVRSVRLVGSGLRLARTYHSDRPPPLEPQLV